MNNWAIASLPLLGVVIGAAVQFWFSRTAERDKHVDNLKSQAYADYLRAVAAAAHLRTDEDLVNALRDAADAKARISVYGGARVIRALAQFAETGATLNNERSKHAFVSLVTSMRSGGGTVPAHELELILFGVAQAHVPGDTNQPTRSERDRA